MMDNRIHTMLLAAVALLASSAASLAGGVSTGNTPLIDFQQGELYLGTFEGGLYPGASNTPPAAHLNAALALADEIVPRNSLGVPDPDGVIVMLSIGMSNTAHESAVFERQEDLNPARNARLIIIDGALGGQSAAAIANPAATYWTIVDDRLTAMGLTAEQVQAVWVKEANPGQPANFPIHAQSLRDDLKADAQNLHDKFANLKIAYLSSRTYGGYSPIWEPQAYETGFSVKWLIEDQINGDPELNFDPANGLVRAPLLLWGPYLWADGIIPRSDGLVWFQEDFENDGTHPSPSAEQKVADLLSGFFAGEPTAQAWFSSQGNATLTAVDALADSYVSAVNPTQTFGSDPTLRASAAPTLENTYLRFDVSAIQGQVIWAKLDLRIPTDATATSTSVTLVGNTTWQEAAINFNNAPAIDGALVASIPTMSRDGTIAADMAQAVTTDADGLISVALTISGGQPSVYVSKEGGHPPRLIIALVPDEIAGDIDGDGDVDEADQALFVAVLLGIDPDALHVARSDLSGDGLANGDDVSLFVAARLSGG